MAIFLQVNRSFLICVIIFSITENDLNGLGFQKIFTAADVKSITDMSNAGNRQLLYQIGCKSVDSIKPEHFKQF